LVSDAVVVRSESTVPPSPCRVLMISIDSLLVSAGVSAANSGLKPLNRVVRSSAGWVWSSPMVAPGGSGSPEPAASTSAR
jgi:hypothetical protein